MRSYRNSRGVFQLDIYHGDNAQQVIEKVQGERAAGITNAVAILKNAARMTNNLRAALIIDYDAYVHDGSEMW